MTLYSVEFLGITFDGEPDGDGITWCWESLDGWHGAVARGQMLTPEGFNGELAAGHSIGSRPLLFAGFVGVPDGDAWWLAVNTLEAAVQAIIGVDSELIVNEPTPKGIMARLAPGSRLTIGRKGELRPTTGDSDLVTAGFTFTIPLVCLDPLKYVA